MPPPCPTAGHEQTKSRGEDTTRRTWRTNGRHGNLGAGAKADTWRTQFTWRTYGAQCLEADRKRTHGGHKAGTWRTQGGLKADARRAHGGHMTRFWGSAKADSRRTQAGHTADKVWRRARIQGGHMEDKLQGRGQSISRPALFSSKREPRSKLFGESDTRIDPKQFFKHKWDALARLKYLEPKWQPRKLTSKHAI